MCARVCVRARVCARVCARACVRACVCARACEHACVRMCTAHLPPRAEVGALFGAAVRRAREVHEREALHVPGSAAGANASEVRTHRSVRVPIGEPWRARVHVCLRLLRFVAHSPVLASSLLWDERVCWFV